ncbi:MAG: YibE/F family protein [Peptostreptococcaceae bacterium]
MMKDKIIYISTIIISIMLIIVGNKIVTKDSQFFNELDNQQVIKAKIIDIKEEVEDNYSLGETETIYQTKVIFTAKVLNGENKGKEVTATQNIDTLLAVQADKINIGDKVLIGETEDVLTKTDWVFLEYVRSDALLVLLILFFIGLLVFGGIKGVNTIISLGFTCLSIFMVFIPSILSGKNIYLWSILTCTFIIIMTLLIVSGASKKSLAAGIGCFSGIFISGILTLIMDKIIKLTGMVNDESMYLQMINTDNPIDLKAIVFASIIIGAIGAIMDVSMSISSSLMEVYENSSNTSFRDLFKSGMNIGKDIMGTMANTLILAYIGSSLSMTLLLIAYNYSFIELLNREMIVVEVLQSLVGSFGILLTIPLTSLVCAYLYTNKVDNKI